jgi:hypothetical protein
MSTEKPAEVSMSTWISLITLVVIVVASASVSFLLLEIHHCLVTIAGRVVAFEQAIATEDITSGQVGWLVNQLSSLVPKLNSRILSDREQSSL